MMQRRRFVVILGIFIALIPFLGFPGSWEEWFIVISGVSIALLSADLSFLGKKKRGRARRKTPSADVFVENTPMKSGEEYRSEFRP